MERAAENAPKMNMPKSCDEQALGAQLVLQETFAIKKTSYNVELDGENIRWKNPLKPKEGFVCIRLENVLCVSTSPALPAGELAGPIDTDKGAKSKTKDMAVGVQLTIHYVKKKPSHVWRHDTITFRAPASTNKEDIDPWVTYIRDYCSRLNRPKRLLVFINPGSGGGEGQTIYEICAAPLFKLSNVHTEVVITENKTHVERVLADRELNIDGIVCVGGDGSFLQCCHGVIKRMAKEAGLDLNDLSQTPVASSIPIGIIPAGTGQGHVKNATLCSDPVTATLHIILGHQHRIHVHSVYNAGKFISFGALLVAYGLFGDIIGMSERLRHLKRARYLEATTKVFAKPRKFEGELRYLPVPGTESKPSAATADESNVFSNYAEDDSGKCEIVATKKTEPAKETKVGDKTSSAASATGREHLGDGSEESAESAEWKTVEGSFYGISVFFKTLGPTTSEKRLKEGQITPPDPNVPSMKILQMLSTCSKSQFPKTSSAMMSGNDSGLDNETLHRCKALEFKFTVDVEELDETNNWLNIDGEAHRLQAKTIHVRSHANLIPMFGLGSRNIVTGGQSS